MRDLQKDLGFMVARDNIPKEDLFNQEVEEIKDIAEHYLERAKKAETMLSGAECDIKFLKEQHTIAKQLAKQEMERAEKAESLNKELAEAVSEAVNVMGEVYNCVDTFEFPEVCPREKIARWNDVLAKAKEVIGDEKQSRKI